MQSEILTAPAKEFLERLFREFEPSRQALLAKRIERQKHLQTGELPDFLAQTQKIRSSVWKVSPPPKDLEDRRVEITGPAEPKMIINALNCGAQAFMADFEDALSPKWENLMMGQKALKDAVRRTLRVEQPGGKTYTLNQQLATLMVRPRGWHLSEKHFSVNGQPMSGSLFDFGLYFFHNAQELVARGSGFYFYLPKMESHQEARLWNQVFDFSEDYLKLPRGTVRATVLIETILAAFEMDEILYELKEHIVGLNAGRWDYLFSAIKKFSHDKTRLFPDRATLTMAVPFMRAYTRLLVQTCHRRGVHAMGGMVAFIPSRKDPKVNETAFSKVREDKDREARGGFDGTWVAHPDLVPLARECFDAVLKGRPHQKENPGESVKVTGADLIDFKVEGASVTEAGIRNNISVALQYLERWLSGQGAVGIFNLMEDAATAEISRAQLWQWCQHWVLTKARYESLKQEELSKLEHSARFAQAEMLLDQLVLSPKFTEFLTIPAYEQLQ